MTKRISTSHTLAVVCALVLAGAGCATETGGATAAPQSAAAGGYRSADAHGRSQRDQAPDRRNGPGPARHLPARIPRVLVLLEAPAAGDGQGRVSRGCARLARLRQERQACRRRRLRHPSPDGRRGRPDRRARPENGGRRRTRLGCARRLERRPPPPRSLYRRRGDERAVRRPVGSIAARDDEEDLRRQLLLHPVFPGTGRRRGRVRQGSAQVPEPPVSLARLSARAAGDHRPQDEAPAAGSAGWARPRGCRPG